jgi:hypothetical protein
VNGIPKTIIELWLCNAKSAVLASPTHLSAQSAVPNGPDNPGLASMNATAEAYFALQSFPFWRRLTHVAARPAIPNGLDTRGLRRCRRDCWPPCRCQADRRCSRSRMSDLGPVPHLGCILDAGSPRARGLIGVETPFLPRVRLQCRGPIDVRDASLTSIHVSHAGLDRRKDADFALNSAATPGPVRHLGWHPRCRLISPTRGLIGVKMPTLP